MASEKLEGHGPSWYDVEVMKEYIERTYPSVVYFEVTASRNRFSGAYGWWVRAVQTEPGNASKPTGRVGAYGFRGGAGAKTMPAAMMMALHKLIDRLEDDKETAERQARF